MLSVIVTKRFSSKEGDRDFHFAFELAVGEVLGLTGISGAGKTTLLRIVAGLTNPRSGKIVMNGEVWYDSVTGVHLPPQKRRIGFVFQEYALFPNMTVRENVAYAFAAAEGARSVDELLELMGLGDLGSRKPDALSGGQRQRVALARALACRPALLLLDEPLSALDNATRARLQDDLYRIHEKFKTGTLLVTHDVAEMFKLCRRVAVIEAGAIARCGTPEEIFGGAGKQGTLHLPAQVVRIKTCPDAVTITLWAAGNFLDVKVGFEEAENISAGQDVSLYMDNYIARIHKS